MDWQTFIAGFSLIILHEYAAISFWVEKNVPFWQIFFIVAVWTSFTLIIFYFFAAAVEKQLRKTKPIAKFLDWFQNGLKNKREKRFLNWFRRHKNWGMFIFATLPIPGFGIASTVFAEIIKLKFGLLIILIANNTRALFTVAVFYWAIKLIILFFS